MKKTHLSQLSTPKRARSKKKRVQYQPPREETPFSKPQKRRIGLVDAVYLVITVLAGSALLGLCHNSFATYMTTRSMLKEHTAQLHRLKVREKSLSVRLAELKSPEGRDQLLRERGFVQGDERILLFADDAQPATSPAVAPSVSSADPQPVSAGNSSFWGGIVKAIDVAADRSATD